MPDRLRRALPVLVGLVLFLVALEVLRVELRAVSWRELTKDVLDTGWPQLLVALLLTALNYVILTGYDFLALAYIGKSLPRWRIAVASFLAYAIANNVGFGMLSGASVRYRFYTRWGVTAEELSRIVFCYSVTFWLGLLGLSGLSLAVSPLPATLAVPAQDLVPAVGWILALAPAAYLAATVIRRRPIRIGRVELPLPAPGLAGAQIVISAIDWTLAGLVLYVLLPSSDLSFLSFLGSFLAAILLGMVSHVPGGIGVFEGLMVLLLKPYLGSGEILPALLVYRAVYYVLPLVVALVGLVTDELRRRRADAARVSATLGRLTEQLTPRVLAMFTFLSGAVLLFSGATPAAASRLERLGRVLPLGVIEVSHFIGSVMGAALLLLSQGLARRLDAAYYLTAGAIVIGILASLLKGFDVEETALLGVVLLVLWRARPAFDRRAAFLETRFSGPWIATLVGAIGASVWLGVFAFKHVGYADELWWRFELHGEASRFLRASVGAAVAVLLFAFARLIRHAPHQFVEPSEADLVSARAAIDAQDSTFPNLVFLRDKAVLFNEARTGFVMYGVQGRTWVALGDPVGAADEVGGLACLFLERCEDFGGVPVFYEVSKDHLHRYADFGMTFVKLGEEAKTNLQAFSLEGSHAAKYRQALRRLEKEGATFRVLEPAEIPAVMAALKAVSDDWLEAKAGAEKGFSLGFFEESYVARFPVAVIERAGRIEAFANLWPSVRRQELSIDLMRYHRDAPKGVMEALFVHLMTWGKAQGYTWFALGMAPLSGFERSAVASLWNRLGSFLYEHGESMYNFQGLRAYKDKFNPVWEPRYLAYQGGMTLPRVIADVSAVVAGGYRKIFLK